MSDEACKYAPPCSPSTPDLQPHSCSGVSLNPHEQIAFLRIEYA